MTIVFTAPQSYAWSNPSPRPAKPPAFAQEVAFAFLNSHYAQSTTVAQFLQAHPNVFTTGVLNQLHRRHIIAWDTIKNFMAKAARTNHNNQTGQTVQPIVDWFGIRGNYQTAANMAHGAPRAAAFTTLANGMCWQIKNVFVGPSGGNVGVDIDQGADLTDQDRRDLLAGTPWRGADMIHAIMVGFAEA